jgi:hypothetical protein
LTAKGEELCNRGIEVLKSVITGIISSLTAEEIEQLQVPLRTLRQQALDGLYLELSLPPDVSPDETIPVKW